MHPAAAIRSHRAGGRRIAAAAGSFASGGRGGAAGTANRTAAVVARAVSDDPLERFATAGAMAAAARAALESGAETGTVAAEEEAPAALANPAPAPQRRRPFEPAPLSSGLARRVVALCDSVVGMGIADGEALADLVLTAAGREV